MASEDGWRKKLDDPIVLPNGKTLVTLRDAVHHLAATVPKRERDHPAVLNAADHLTGAAEQGYPLFFARAATLQAVHRNRERVFDPTRLPVKFLIGTETNST